MIIRETQRLCAGTHFCIVAQQLRNSYLPSLLRFQLYHIPPGAHWFIAVPSYLLPTISACGGWDGASSSHLTIGFSADILLHHETNLAARVYEPVCWPLCNTTAKAPCCSPSMNIEDRCYPCVGLIFPNASARERGGRSFWRAPACRIHCLSGFCVPTCLWTLVSCSRLFSRKEIFCFWVIYPTLSSGSIPVLCWQKSGDCCINIVEKLSRARRREGTTYFSNSNGEVLNEKLAKAVEGVELTSLRYHRNGEVERECRTFSSCM